jgi:hypothetical protein
VRKPNGSTMVEPLRANTHQPALNSEHCRAICEETGERLRQSLKQRGPSRMRPRLSRLLGRLSELDGADALRRAFQKR